MLASKRLYFSTHLRQHHFHVQRLQLQFRLGERVRRSGSSGQLCLHLRLLLGQGEAVAVAVAEIHGDERGLLVRAGSTW